MYRAVFDQKSLIQALAEYLNSRDRDHPKEGQIARLELHRNEAILTWNDNPENQSTS
jgi:hypothetical protein